MSSSTQSGQAGQALSPKNNSLQSFLTSLVINAIALLVEVTAFTFLKNKYHRVYSPRSFLPPLGKRAAELPNRTFRWIPTVIKTPSREIIRKNGLDAYLLVRFLRLLIKIFVPSSILTWLVIIPVDAVGMGGYGIQRFTTGNVSQSAQRRYAAHVIVTYIITAWIIWLIRGEMLRFVHLRHQFLISQSHSKLAQAKTILITSLPDDLTTEKDLQTFASFVPGGVAKIWIYRDAPGLNDLHKQRLAACAKLEGAISELLRKVTKKKAKEEKARATKEKLEHKKSTQPPIANDNGPTDVPPPIAVGSHDPTSPAEMLNGTPDVEKGGVKPTEVLLHDVKRPTHRLGAIPFFGKKVDTLDWAIEEIPKLDAEILKARQELPKTKPHSAAMIMCNLQMGAHVLAQCISYHEPLKMVDKWIELSPDDVVWDNIDDSATSATARYIGSWILTLGIIFLWSFPVAFSGSLSNLDQLGVKWHFLSWLTRLPVPIPGIIEGVLPPLFLAILFILLPYILEALAYFEGIPRKSLISISVYRRYYLFLMINGFLVITLSSGLTTAIPQIAQNPGKGVQELATNLPSASTFYLTYLVAQGFTAAGTALLQGVPLLLHFVRRILFGNTPRQAYSVEYIMPSTDLGMTLPRLSLLATIGIAYSVIAPMICVFSAVAFTFIWFSWKFLMTWVMDQPEAQETGGLYFPLVISNLFVGLYVEQLCMAALFFLATDERGRHDCLVEAIVMLLLVVITAGAQIILRNAFRPITDYLPMSLATRDMVRRYNLNTGSTPGIVPFQDYIPQIGGAIRGGFDQTIDLISRDHVAAAMRKGLRIKPRGDSATVSDTVAERPSADGYMPKTIPSGADAIVSERSPASVAPMPSPRNDQSTPRRKGSSSSIATSEGTVSRRSSVRNDHRLRDEAITEGGDDNEDEAIDEHAFDHPSTYKPQPCIWIPKDTLGLSDGILVDLRAAGIDASDLGATINNEGRVKVTRGPPDVKWAGQDI